MSDLTSSIQTRNIAAENGWDVVVPGPRTLTIDIDSPIAGVMFDRNLEWLQENLQTVFEVRRIPSKSHEEGHEHIYIEWPEDLDELSIPERIALQAALGSDGKRELSSYLRYMARDPEPILLFEEKPKTRGRK